MKLKVGYGRLSIQEQATNQHTREQQIARLSAIGDVEILFDIGSGADPNRKNFQRLLKMIEADQVSVIYATRGDRLARNYETYTHLKNLTKKHKVKVELLDEGIIDWETASGEFSADIRALLAEDERRRIKERVSKGFEYRRLREAACARSPFGYQTINDCYELDKRPIVCLRSRRPANFQQLAHFEIDALPSISRSDIARELIDKILIVRRPRTALRLLYEEYGVERRPNQMPVLVDELLLFGPGSSVIGWCRNPVLRGHTAYLKTKPTDIPKQRTAQLPEDWEFHYDTHPDHKLMTEAEFNELEMFFDCNRKKVGDPDKGTFYLTGLIFCEACGQRMILKNSTLHRYYGCRHSGVGCDNRKNIRAEILDEAVIAQLFEQARTFSQSSASQDATKLENQDIAALREQIEVLNATLKNRPTPALQQTKYALEQELADLLNPNRTAAFIQATAEHIMRHPQAQELAFWYSLQEPERMVIYHLLVKQITVSKAGQVVAVTLNV